MPLNRITCPDCGAGLKSAAGFNPGQQVRCPKCSAAFAVEAPAFEEVEDDPPAKPKGPPPRARRVADDEDDDRPRRRRRDEDDDDDEDDDRPRRKKGKKKAGGYKNSPVRYAVLAVLLVVMGVLFFLLTQKWKKEKEEANAPAPAANTDDEGGARPRGAQRTPPGGGGPKFDADGAGARPGPGGGGNNTAAATAEQRRAVNDLKQIMLAMHNHHDATGALPAAAITAKDGTPLLSWRVAILPYIEQQELYKQFKLTEPWDSPANKKLIQYMPRTYQGTAAAGDGKTAFKVFVGGGAAFDLRRGKGFRDVPDGTSNTLAVVEAGPPVEWTKPEDIPFDGKTPPRLVPPGGGDVLLISTLDGATRRISLTANPPETILKAVTAGGGELFQFE